MDAPMMVRFDVEAYGQHFTNGEPFTEAEYAANKDRWRGHAETFVAAAQARGARAGIEDIPEDQGGERSVSYYATAYMDAAQFHRMLMDIAPTPFGALVRGGTSIAASIQDGYEGAYEAQTLLIDPILPYLAHVYIDSEYDGQEGVFA
jgi:hypothetical protein